MQEVCLLKTREEFFYLPELCNTNQDNEFAKSDLAGG